MLKREQRAAKTIADADFDLSFLRVFESLPSDTMNKPTYAERAAFGLTKPTIRAPPIVKSTTVAGSRKRPDVYVQSFVPQAFTAINQSPATLIKTPPRHSIDFEKYVSTLYGQGFRASLPIPQIPLSDGARLVDSPNKLNAYNYGGHFQDCIVLDVEAEIYENRSFDIFGATLTYKDPTNMIFTLQVPGLREGSPSVNFGDTVRFRQWVESPLGPSQVNPHGWPPSGTGWPGFTGYEIEAIVIGVDKITGTLHIQAFGLFGYPQIRCNVSFVKQTRVVQSLQLAVMDISSELQATPKSNGTNTQAPAQTSVSQDIEPVGPKYKTSSHPHSKNSWLQRMLFPQEVYGVRQEGLPSVNFPQSWFDTGLNYEQKKAVDAVTTTNYGQLCYLINGPPGTGKTKTICEIVTQMGKHPDFPGSMLLCAPSNQAADTLAQRLSKLFDPSEMLRLNHLSRTFAEVPMDLMLYCFVDENIFNIPPIAKLMSYKIVITTCQDADILIQARVSNRDLFNLQRSMTTTLHPHQKPPLPSPPLHWSAIIIDEAAQATEPDTLIPLSVVAPPSDTSLEVVQPIFVMAGDQYQLGPRIYNKTTLLSVSLFERLSNDPVYASHPLARKSIRSIPTSRLMLRPPFANLTRNYRSHPAILAVPSSLFYANTLIPEAIDTKTVSQWDAWSTSKQHWPVQFRCNGGSDECEDIRDSTHGWYNRSEALKAMDCAQSVLGQKSQSSSYQHDICIMSPFRAQVRLLRKIARERNLRLNIGPMEAFQGLESQFVIICTTRARMRFLKDDKIRAVGVIGEPQKFNVSITRAKEGLVVIGNPCVLATDPYWLAFLSFCWRNGLWQRDSVLHTKMYNAVEGKVNDWEPKVTDDECSGLDPKGLEAALLFKEKEQWQGSNAAKRFLGSSEEDQAYRHGMEAEEALREFNDIALHEYGHEKDEDVQDTQDGD